MSTNDDWQELVDRHLRDELTEPEMERLAEWLDSNPAARQSFVEESLWDTRMAEVLRGGSDDETAQGFAVATASNLDLQKSRNTVLRLMLAAAVAVIVVLSVGLYQQQAQAERRIAKIQSNSPEVKPEPSIAKIIGLSGLLIWTGDRGEIQRELVVGTELPGGTVEGVAPDSWFELQFNDGSTVMISGTSMLTFADAGQKVLRLKEGNLSASVEPQPADKPMLLHTHTAVLQVLGTRFDVEASLTSTALNVSEGLVRVRRLSDGGEVDVPAKHRLFTEADNELLPLGVPDAVYAWKSQLQLRPGGYGKWLPGNKQRVASQKAIPLVPPDQPDVTLYLLGIPVGSSQNSPVVVQQDSRFVVRGRLTKPAQVFFGIGMSQANGEFAGKFRGDKESQQPVTELDSDGRFEVVYRLSDFSLDPCVRDRKDELPARPDGLVLKHVWAFTHTGRPSGLEVTAVELIPPDGALLQ
jgi:ferric-dicitrate binding protein FerR (iron transport regulator)